MNWIIYLPVIFFGALAFIFPLASMFLNYILRPEVKEEQKESTYECGEELIGDARIDFPFSHYIYAIIFVAADVMSIFLILWALTFRNLADKSIAVGAILSLLAFVLIGIYYSLRGKVDIGI
ncbi:MAG: NADH-quinone oxidoreductase subunit A [Thermoplasmata archaeon]